MTLWTLGHVIGADGADGDKGDKGDKGDTGATGATGNGIQSITKTGTSGLVDTYTITYTDGSTTTFTVTNGEDGSADIVTSWESTLSDEKVPSEKLVKNSLDAKANSSSLATVATSGSYSDLSSKPTIPTKTSDLTNDGDDGSHSFLDSSDIADNLTTDSSTKVLSAKQGKALKDLIGDAISYINM